MCYCYKIGGLWIAEDPNCQIHGYEAQRSQREREAQDADVQERLTQLDGQLVMLRAVREMAQDAADHGDVLGQRILLVLGA